MGQTCAPRWSTTISSKTNDFSLTFTADSAICSEFRIHVYVDGEERATTTAMRPGQLTTAPLEIAPIASGNVRLELEAEGTTGGCNTGRVYNWGGSLELRTYQ